MHINENFGSQVQQLKSTFDKSAVPFGQEVSKLAHEKNDARKELKTESAQDVLNQQIIQSSLDISFANGQDSSTLILKAAIQEINEVLKSELGVSIEETVDSGVDISPEATAERIVSLSTAFFSSYQEQHPEMDLETAAKSFTSLISGGIDKGFDDALNILEGLNVLEGDTASNIDKTYNLVQEKLQAFIDAI